VKAAAVRCWILQTRKEEGEKRRKKEREEGADGGEEKEGEKQAPSPEEAGLFHQSQ
jgi:hypothetical protein